MPKRVVKVKQAVLVYPLAPPIVLALGHKYDGQMGLQVPGSNTSQFKKPGRYGHIFDNIHFTVDDTCLCTAVLQC